MNIAGSMLNICAILSSLRKHKKAIHYACSAVELIQTQMKNEKRRSKEEALNEQE
eukprot:CAMPEP_0170565390 /NCGR_PEP_ID=MMETSP0211-20121228/78681_1 /TAXON_ID=311385 /ORGANISM="Pseudokeronopsis sp., Strain OXSARD2" /LENGTH=54 /DNA_ID=CAMNT_0010886165 /DNA_START=164 /DNA_END=328 /DNA_ORIENTATION=-